MYTLTADYHTHTVFSKHKHGKNTPRENIEAAIAKGLKTIGISDHAPGHLLFGIKDIAEYIQGLRLLKEEYKDKINVEINIEANFIGLQGQTDIDRYNNGDFDKIILGFHQCVVATDFASAFAFYGHRLFARNSRSMIAKATDMYIAAIEKGNLAFISHPGHAIALDMKAIAEACKAYGTWLEINNTHQGLPADVIADIAKTGVQFVVSSDAHRAADIGKVDTAMQRLIDAGLTEREVVNIQKIEEV